MDFKTERIGWIPVHPEFGAVWDAIVFSEDEHPIWDYRGRGFSGYVWRKVSVKIVLDK